MFRIRCITRLTKPVWVAKSMLCIPFHHKNSCLKPRTFQSIHVSTNQQPCSMRNWRSHPSSDSFWMLINQSHTLKSEIGGSRWSSQPAHGWLQSFLAVTFAVVTDWSRTVKPSVTHKLRQIICRTMMAITPRSEKQKKLVLSSGPSKLKSMRSALSWVSLFCLQSAL